MLKNAAILLLASALAALLWIQRRESVASAEKAAHPLERLLEDYASQPGFAGAVIGFCLLDKDGFILAAKAPHQALIPASSLKTVTTATALEVMGPEHRIQTRLMATAAMVDGVIPGDLVIVGGGDPMLALKDLQIWAAQLQRRGLKRVAGRVLGDGRLFSGSIYNDFWGWGDIGNGFGSPVSGLNLEHNRFSMSFRAADAVGKPAELLGETPEVPGISWVNEVLTGPAGSGDGVMIHGGEHAFLLHLRGSMPLGEPAFRVLGAVPDPERFAAHHLRLALLGAGVEVGGKAEAVGSRPAGSIELLSHFSPDLRTIITSIHATSDNHETECLFRLLGLRASKSAELAVKLHWKARGLEFSGLRMEDGCGLARADFITPYDLARLQFLAGTGPQADIYKASLLQKGPLRWKGGAMSGVRSTTGFVMTQKSGEMCFALIVNHYADSSSFIALREALMDQVSRL